MTAFIIVSVSIGIIGIIAYIIQSATDNVRENKRKEKRDERELRITIEKYAQEANDIAEGLYRP